MKTLARSFAGGEITPELYGRLDLNKRQTGLALALNMEVLPHGPAARRPGFEYVIQCKDSTRDVRIMPFEFNVDQALILEFGHLYLRFHTPAGTVLESSAPIVSITQAAVGVFNIPAHGWTTADWVYLSSIAGMTDLNGAFYIVNVVDANNVTLARLDGTPLSTLTLPAYAGAGRAARVYTIATPYDGAITTSVLFDIHYTQSNDVFTLVHPGVPAQELRRLGAASWTLTPISFAPTVPAPTGLTATATVAVATNLTTQNYVVLAVGADGVSESVISTSANCINNLTLAGNFNTIDWVASAGAVRYKVFKQKGGSWGYIGQTSALTMIDDNITADASTTPPDYDTTLNGSVDNYPAAVTYHEQRRWFGGTNNKPQGIWATRNGTESNLSASSPLQDADALTFKVNSRQQNRVRHMLPLSDLAVFTNAAEWRIFADNAPAITFATLSTKPSGYSGANNVQPVATGGSLLYVQAQGSFVRELSYGGAESNYNYRTIDLSVMAPHLFEQRTIVDIAYTRAPDQRLWVVRSDGQLLGMTYLPEQQVYAWHQHDTGASGKFKSVAAIVSNNQDMLYAVVERNIDGRVVKYIERRRQRVYGDLVNAFFVDSGLTYTGAPAQTIGGLWHLNNMEVDILADGGVEARRRVANGKITLPAPASLVSVGLPGVARMKTLPLAMEGVEAGGQGVEKSINEVVLRVVGSNAVKAGSSFENMRSYPAREVSDDYDAPPAQKTGEVRVTVDGGWSPEGSVCVEQDLPLPLTVASLVLDVEPGG
jgi:hypothetical protein